MINRITGVYQKYLPDLNSRDKSEAEAIMFYLLGRVMQKRGLPDQALSFFKKSQQARNLNFKLRSFCWVVFLILVLKILKQKN
jgi:type VI protein secretion system component VasF